MPQTVKYLVGSALALVALPTSANAALLNFELSGSRNLSFQLDSNPTPSGTTSNIAGTSIRFDNVSILVNGTSTQTGTVSFGTGGIAKLNINGLSAPNQFTQFAGATLFNGSLTAPMFSTGTFALTSLALGGATLTISPAQVAAIPEPATWAMMIAGFGIVGSVLRRRPSRTPVTA